MRGLRPKSIGNARSFQCRTAAIENKAYVHSQSHNTGKRNNLDPSHSLQHRPRAFFSCVCLIEAEVNKCRSDSFHACFLRERSARARLASPAWSVICTRPVEETPTTCEMRRLCARRVEVWWVSMGDSNLWFTCHTLYTADSSPRATHQQIPILPLKWPPSLLVDVSSSSDEMSRPPVDIENLENPTAVTAGLFVCFTPDPSSCFACPSPKFRPYALN